MRKTIKLTEAVKDNSDSDYTEFNNQIKFLIDDEKEAIEGYEKAVSILKDKMTDYQNNEIYKIMSHIIDEEKEHIEELKQLQLDIDKKSEK